MTSELLRSARARRGFGKRPTANTTNQVARADERAAVNTLILASSSSAALKAQGRDRRRGGEPDPRQYRSAEDRRPALRGAEPPRVHVGSRAEMNVTPKGLPTIVPATIPRVTGEVKARERRLPSTGMPALARPKRGTIR